MTTEFKPPRKKPVPPKSPGRPAGVRNKKTRKLLEEIEKSGQTPLDYMLTVMRNPKADPKRRDAMAAAAAPYVHPKLATLEHTGPKGGPIQTVSKVELVALDKE